MSEKTTSEFMLEIASHYLMNGCDDCPFYDVTKTCDSKPINCTWMALRNYFKAEESKEELPSAEPERMKGKWEVQPSTGEDRPFIWWKCSECGHVIFSETERDRKEFHAFCGRCGTEMTRGDDE